jgi:diguanylate cyclase (GGDEF)-like protein
VRCRLGEWKRGGQSFSVIFIEIDHFRSFCESHGQEAGEGVVHRFGDLLVTATREMDMVARYSATTYAVLLPKTTLSEAATVAARVREHVADDGLVGPDLEERFTVSVGLVCVEESDDVIRLLQRCEAALTSARTSGANVVHIHNGQWTEALSAAMLPTG